MEAEFHFTRVIPAATVVATPTKGERILYRVTVSAWHLNFRRDYFAIVFTAGAGSTLNIELRSPFHCFRGAVGNVHESPGYSRS